MILYVSCFRERLCVVRGCVAGFDVSVIGSIISSVSVLLITVPMYVFCVDWRRYWSLVCGSIHPCTLYAPVTTGEFEKGL